MSSHLRTKVSSNLNQTLKYTYRQCFSYLALCCSMASRALNSKGRECVCDASWEARSSTSQRSRPRPRKSNTSSDWGVTIAFKVWNTTHLWDVSMVLWKPTFVGTELHLHDAINWLVCKYLQWELPIGKLLLWNQSCWRTLLFTFL